MQHFLLLTRALDFIEENLEHEIGPESVALHCYCSLSSLQKRFRLALGLGVKDYIERRRMTQAARQMLEGTQSVTDVAMRYQYQSPEVFIRAFRRVWDMTPTAFRRQWHSSGLFPRIQGMMIGGNGTMRKQIDISELYDTLKTMQGTYVLSFDIVNLIGINDISRKAGDIAIREALRRIDAAATEDMLAFRIGGDEYALVTGLSDPAQVESVAEKVLRENGRSILMEGQSIPLSLRAAAIRMDDGNLRYAALYDKLNESVLHAPNDNQVHFQ